MKFGFALVVIGSLFMSCEEPYHETESLNGVWESIGSGVILHVQDSSEYSLYNITSSSCLPARQSDLEEILGSLSLHSDTLSMKLGVMTYKYTRAKELPELCGLKLPESKRNDPLYNFEIFAETVEEHYAFMELNAIDWPSLYQEEKNKLNPNSSAVELYLVLEETLERLKDNHAFLEANDEVYDELEELEDDLSEDTLTEALIEYGDFVIANLVTDHHLIEDMTTDSWLINWGMMEDNIGYIQIKTMWLFADLDISDSLIEEMGFVDAYVKTFNQMYEGTYTDLEVNGVQKVMDRVMEDLMPSESIVIDVRFNGGGQDAVSFEILKRFNPQRLQIVKSKLTHQGSTTADLPIFLEAASDPYTKPVYVLTSTQTGSAAEAFAVGSIPIPHVRRIGSRTQGALSTTLDKILPNGWVFSISNEIYMDLEGNSYENIGVPVDYLIDYTEDRQAFFRSVADDLDADKQSILRAIEELE